MTPNIYNNIDAHIPRSKMNSINERQVSSEEKPKCMNHTFLKIKILRNSRQTKRNSRSCHHIDLVIRFPMSQEFCNSDSVWESYANFSEDAQKILSKNKLLLCCCEKNLRPISMNSLLSIHHWMFLDGFYIHNKVDMFHAGLLVFKGKSGKNFNFALKIVIWIFNLTFNCHTNVLPLQWSKLTK